MYDRLKAEAAQKKFCEENNAPCFIPPFGMCFSCGRNIFDEGNKEGTFGYTVEEAGERLITGCPFCHKSFCD